MDVSWSIRVVLQVCPCLCDVKEWTVVAEGKIAYGPGRQKNTEIRLISYCVGVYCMYAGTYTKCCSPEISTYMQNMVVIHI